MVTGSPAMISNSSMKSLRCIGRILASAARRPSSFVGHDHLAHRDDAVGLEEHVLGAAQADALGAEIAGGAGIERGLGIGAHLHAARLSAQSMMVAKSPESSGLMVGTSPFITWPVEPSMVMTSPFLRTTPTAESVAWR